MFGRVETFSLAVRLLLASRLLTDIYKKLLTDIQELLTDIQELLTDIQELLTDIKNC